MSRISKKKRSNNFLDGKVDISVSYSVLGIGLIAVFLVIVGLIWAQFKLEFKDYVSLASASFTAIALIYTTTSLKAIQANNMSVKVRQMAEKWNSEQLIKSSSTIKVLESNCTSKDHQYLVKFIADSIKDDHSISNDAKVICNYFELISNEILAGSLDEEAMKDLFRSLFIWYHNVLGEYIKNEQAVPGQKNVYDDYCTIVNRWK